MITPTLALDKLKAKITYRHRTAFLSAFFLGLLIHLPMLLMDVPNHDGLASMYFDQNMITSGRWFLTIACGFSSYFTVPWVIGLLGLLFLGCTAAALTEVLELESRGNILLVSGLLVAFPSLASTFAYVFTLDGYMLAMLLAVLAVLLTKKYKYGFLPGGVALAFSMGTYQAYLAFAVLLCIYLVAILAADGEFSADRRKAAAKVGRYLGMGLLGAVLYYGILRILLLIQGKELASYQGIGQVGDGAGSGLGPALLAIYKDFGVFSLKGNILFQNVFSAAALLVLTALTLLAVICLASRHGWWKKPGFYAVVLLLVLCIPVGSSCIRLVSPELNYHLLMRYQWVVFPIAMIAFLERYGREAEGKSTFPVLTQWGVVLSAAALVFCYGLADNIGYTNLQKKYERTYAYCVRLLDRIEQTPGYYQGIPIVMTGVIGDHEFPATDITGNVTGQMIGLSGEVLVYTGENYKAFMKHYLGASLNFLDAEAMGEIYYSEEYMEMDSFPGPNSTKVVDGVLYVKTENKNRD